jgi:hypothetical protein
MSASSRSFSNKSLSLLIAIVYVSLATGYSYWMVNQSPQGLLAAFLSPASHFPSLILFTEPSPAVLVLLCQVVTLLAIWGLLYAFLQVVRKTGVAEMMSEDEQGRSIPS